MLVVAPEKRYSMLQVTTQMAKILSAARSSPEKCQPHRMLNLLHTHSLPHLLDPHSPEEYWPPVTLPPPESLPTTAPQDPEYEFLEDVFDLSPGLEDTENVDGWLDVRLRGESSLGRPSNSFITSSSVMHRSSGDYAGSVTPATTRQPSVRDRVSHESRRSVLARGEGRPGGIPDLRISGVSLDKERRTEKVDGRREIQTRGRRQAMKQGVRKWKGNVKSTLLRLMRLSGE